MEFQVVIEQQIPHFVSLVTCLLKIPTMCVFEFLYALTTVYVLQHSTCDLTHFDSTSTAQSLVTDIPQIKRERLNEGHLLMSLACHLV